MCMYSARYHLYILISYENVHIMFKRLMSDRNKMVSVIIKDIVVKVVYNSFIHAILVAASIYNNNKNKIIFQMCLH